MNKINIMKLIIDEKEDVYLDYLKMIEEVSQFEGDNIIGYHYVMDSIIVFCEDGDYKWLYVLQSFVTKSMLNAIVPFYEYYVTPSCIGEYTFVKIVKEVNLKEVLKDKKICLLL